MKRENIVSIGIIGAAGAIGNIHAECITSDIEHAAVRAVYDIDTQKCQAAAEKFDAIAHQSAEELITSTTVDAVLIASWDATHADFVQKCIAAGKPVFCEKPLATNISDCKKIVESEQRAGKTLVQLGFMRRFDADYKKMKKILNSGALGSPLMAHCISRTPRVADSHTTSMHITNIVIHEIDLFRWLLDEEMVKAGVLFPRSTSFAANTLKDPQLVIMQSESGVLIDVEVSANSYYGYEIGCEIVCEKGTISLPIPFEIAVRSRLSCTTEIPDSWENRFPGAYRAELQHWVGSILGAYPFTAASSQDGYAAQMVCETLIKSQESGKMEAVFHL